MKNIKKIAIIIFVSIMAFTNNVYAANISLKAGITANKQTVQQGEQVVITISLKDFEGTGSGVNGFEAILDYNKNVFEEIQLEEGGNTSLSIDALNRWDVPTFNTENNKLATTKGAFVNTNENIIQITLTVKSNPQIGNTTISLLNVAASDGTDLIQIQNESIVLQVVSSQPQNPPQNETEENIITPTVNILGPTGTNTVTNNNYHLNTVNPTNNVSSSNIVMSGSLPQTGVSSIIAVAITIIAINAIIAFIKYKNTK